MDNLEIVDLLLEAEAKLNMRNNEGNTPLHEIDNLEIIDRLLEAGAKPNIRNNDGDTPLHYLEEKDVALARILIANGADPLMKDDRGEYTDVVRNNPFLVKESSESKKKETSCQYITESSQINAVQLRFKYSTHQ